MTRSLKLTVPAVIVGLGVLISSNTSFAKVSYTKKEGVKCVVCHTKPASKELNDVGKCYEKNKSMQGCAPADKKG
jgi:hypothetical protein